MKKINHAAVWVSFILLTGLGFLWYDTFFGNQWMELVGLNYAEVEANPPSAEVWITNTIGTIVPLYVMAWLWSKLRVESGMEGAWIGFLIAFSFVFLSKLTGDMFAQNPYALSLITGGYDVVALTLSGFILGMWRKKSSTSF